MSDFIGKTDPLEKGIMEVGEMFFAALNQNPSCRIFMIAGPTAGGKSRLATDVATNFDGEIVNADSIQIYKDLSLLTARPDLKSLTKVPHHLYGHVDAADAWSVGKWLEAVRAIIQDILQRGKQAIIVGGTGLYFKALTHGLADIPPIDPQLRQDLRDFYASKEGVCLWQDLAALDPLSASVIRPNDRQRLLRALEVFHATGRSLTDWQKDTKSWLTPDQWCGVALLPERSELYKNCDQRLRSMVEKGVLEEVKALHHRHLPPHLPIMKALGYQAFCEHLEGKTGLEQALSIAQQQTRNYAKRQYTWFRHQMTHFEIIRS